MDAIDRLHEVRRRLGGLPVASATMFGLGVTERLVAIALVETRDTPVDLPVVAIERALGVLWADAPSPDPGAVVVPLRRALPTDPDGLVLPIDGATIGYYALTSVLALLDGWDGAPEQAVRWLGSHLVSSWAASQQRVADLVAAVRDTTFNTGFSIEADLEDLELQELDSGAVDLVTYRTRSKETGIQLASIVAEHWHAARSHRA